MDLLMPLYETIDQTSFLACTASSLVLGLILCLIYSASHRSRKDYTSTLLLMPFVITFVLLAVNSLTGSFVIVSIFTLTRFRTVQYKAEEIMTIFAAVVLGLLCATGYVYMAAIFTIAYALILTAYNKINIRTHKSLQVVIPEDIPFSDLDNPLDKYTSCHTLTDYKTTNLGSLYKLTYDIVEKPNISNQAFIDEIRTINGNLEIEISEYMESKS